MHIVLCRHGETAWSLAGKHTGLTDLDLTEKGKEQAKELKPKLLKFSLEKVFSSPLQRALSTCILADLPLPIIQEPSAVEWDYGLYEGLTTPEIWGKKPQWNLFLNGAPQGESPEEVGRRADLLIAKWLQEQKNIALFSHGHFLRVLAARWIGLDPSAGRFFGLSVSSISVLGFERDTRIIQSWNQL